MFTTNNVDKWSPEDYQLKPEKANIGMRIIAFFIDQIIITTILFVPFIIFAFQNAQNDPAKLFLMIPILMVAIFLFLCLKDCVHGASIGKRALGLAVRNSQNASEVPSIPKLFLRNILMFICQIEFLVLVCSADKTKLGDKLARTDVFCVGKKVRISIIIITFVLAISIFVGSLLFSISSAFKNDSSYKMAVNYIESNPEIINLIGEVQNYGFMPTGSLNYRVNNGQKYSHAAYTIKVIGSKDTTYVYIQMEKKTDKDWEIIYFDYKD